MGTIETSIITKLTNKYISIYLDNYNLYVNNKRDFLNNIYAQCHNILKDDILKNVIINVNRMINNSSLINDFLKIRFSK